MTTASHYERISRISCSDAALRSGYYVAPFYCLGPWLPLSFALKFLFLAQCTPVQHLVKQTHRLVDCLAVGDGDQDAAPGASLRQKTTSSGSCSSSASSPTTISPVGTNPLWLYSRSATALPGT